MAGLERLSAAHAILLATQLCASGNVAGLQQLQSRFPTTLNLERLLRIILTFLPESTEPQRYTSVLQALADGTPAESPGEDIDVSPVQNLPEAVARKRVRKLHLLPLRYRDGEEDDGSTDPLTQFLVHRAHRIDTETGLQTLVLDLLLPFYQRSETLRTWLISVLLPLLRLNYEYYPNREETMSMEVLESMDDKRAVNVLLSMANPGEDNTDLVKNLRGLVGPWMYGSGRPKRRKLSLAARRNSISTSQDDTISHRTNASGWHEVNEWLLSRSQVDYDRVVGAFANWNGPEDVDLGGYEKENETLPGDEGATLRKRYGQAGLAVVYANPDTSKRALEGSFQVISSVAKLLELEEHLVTVTGPSLPDLSFDMDSISSTSKASLLQNALLTPSNPLTSPTSQSVSFLSALLLSLRTLGELGHSISCKAAANICLHSSDETQLLELRNVVETMAKHGRTGLDWRKVREQLLWLRDWRGKPPAEENVQSREYHGLFWRVSRDVVETEVLKAMLAVREYQLAVDVYTQSKVAPLKPEQVEAAVTEAIFTAYDNASNGNKTRGGMKRAADILNAFRPHFPTSTSFKQIDALIAATHALSFYSLTLQHGVPFQPVSIRVHPDPLSLIEKVLDQNPKSYTKLDDLISIGRNLVAAGLPTPPSTSKDGLLHHDRDPSSRLEEATITAERRIISLAVSSALSSNDFGTAYSYILTRLTPPSLLPSPSTSTSTPATATTPAVVEDDISWRAAYNAGRHRSTTTPDSNLQAQITHLSQRMELLSLALLLAPSPDPLPEILGAWRRCDEELAVLRAQEAEEAEQWDTKADKTASLTTVPGGFGPTDSELDALENEQQRAKRARASRDDHHHRHRHVHRGPLYEDEAPMGLFDVARGAAQAFKRTAFPLRRAASAAAGGAGGGAEQSVSSPSEEGAGGEQQQQRPPGEGRVRKRDKVSEMVTGGLVTGIGWVLGAQPVNR